MSAWEFVVAPGVAPEEGCREALEAAAAAMPDATLLAAVVPGDEAWPRILDKEDAIEACRHGLVALRAVEPGALLVRDAAPSSFADAARLLASRRGYLVPGARASRSGRAPRVPRWRLLLAPFWSRDERLWLLFLNAGRRAAR